ncbi:hypothetical protein HAX54_016500 [Datura stramonium]|uniref:Uncharacterized protein n=1 Tax=Datura stramonium TaxID=4076 RepID=A0ABS8UJ38_DATST|nr:hypothetical protein [Datura stramonium]
MSFVLWIQSLLTFLLRFIAKEPPCDDSFITEYNVYKQQPWETNRYGRHCGGVHDHTSSYRYFITPIPKGKKADFAGPWVKKLGLGSRINVDRVMKEYVLSDTLLKKFNKSEFRDYVICTIKKKTKKDSSFVEEARVDTEVTSGVNFVEPLMDGVITPVHIVEQMVQIQEAAVVSGQTTSSQIQESMIVPMPENNDPEIMDICAGDTVLEKNQTQQE